MSRSKRTCRRAASVRWTVETHPTLRYCRTHKHLYHPPIGKFDLSSADAAEAVAHLNDLMRIEGNRSIVTPIYYFTVIQPTDPSVVRALFDRGADPEKRSTVYGHVDTLLLAVMRLNAWYPSTMTLINQLLVDRGADVHAVSTHELKTRFGMLPHRQTALGLALFNQGYLSMQEERLGAQRVLIDCLRHHGARLTDGDYFYLWVDRAKRWDRKFLDARYGAALTTLTSSPAPTRWTHADGAPASARTNDNAWSFPPCFFRTARLLAAETKLRDGILGVGLGHEQALLHRIYSYLGRSDIVGFFPEKLETVWYSAKETKKYRDRGRRDKYFS